MEACPYCKKKVASVALHIFLCEIVNPPIESDPSYMETIYLAGAISGLSPSEYREWRITATRLLENQYKILTPLRRDWTPGDPESIKAVIEGDKQDIQDCDLLLVNANSPSWGTAMEIFLAHGLGKEIVIFTSDAAPSIWLTHHSSSHFDNLAQAIRFLKDRAKARRQRLICEGRFKKQREA